MDIAKESMDKSLGRTDTVVSSLETGTDMSQENDAVLPRWFPHCCGRPILHGKPEALGWLLGMCGQTIAILGVGTFVVPALMYFAKAEAGCQVELAEGETELADCDQTVYGMKPSSLITTLASVLSLTVALLTPLMGAIIDYTEYRRGFGRALAFLYVCVVFQYIFISENTWFPLTICLLCMGIIALFLTLVLHAYLPELTDNEDVLNDFTKTFVAVPGVLNLVFIIAVMGVSVALGYRGDEGPTARIAAMMGVVVLGCCFSASWGFLMKPRPSLNRLEPGQWIVTQGFRQIYRTSTNLSRTNVPLLWFYAAVALGDVRPLTGIGLTFISSQQQFTTMDVGVAAITMLISVVPGAMISSFMCRRFDPVRSSALAISCMIVVTLVGALCLTGPNQKLPTYAVIAGWGIIGGWKVTSTSMLVAAIVPEGQDAELMGFYLFADASLSWAPPLIFTAMNEAGLSERAGLASITIFFALSLVAYAKMGSYNASVKTANRLVTAPSDTIMGAISEVGEPTACKVASDHPSSDFRPPTVEESGLPVAHADHRDEELPTPP